MLRQWACVSSILRRSCAADTASTLIPSELNILKGETFGPNGAQINDTSVPPKEYDSVEDELADFLASANQTSGVAMGGGAPATGGSRNSGARNVTLSFTTQPIPQFQIQFTHPTNSSSIIGGAQISISFQVGLNGVIGGVMFDDGMGGVDGVGGVSGDSDDIDDVMADGIAGQSMNSGGPAAGSGDGDGDAMDIGNGAGGDDGQEIRQLRGKFVEKIGKVIEVTEDLGMVVEWVCGQLVGNVGGWQNRA